MVQFILYIETEIFTKSQRSNTKSNFPAFWLGYVFLHCHKLPYSNILHTLLQIFLIISWYDLKNIVKRYNYNLLIVIEYYSYDIAFLPNHEYKFDYDVQILSGLPETSKTTTGLILNARIRLQFLNDRNVILKVRGSLQCVLICWKTSTQRSQTSCRIDDFKFSCHWGRHAG